MSRIVILSCLLVFICAKGNAQLKINEYCPINSQLEDESGDKEAWIELINPTDQALTTLGYFLTNRTDLSMRWALPSFQVPAHANFLVFLSGKTTSSNELHSSFEVESAEETVYLIQTNQGIVDQVNGSGLHPNHSLARIPSESGSFWVVETPSPNQANYNTRYYKGYCEPIHTNRVGGFYPAGVSIKLLPASHTYRTIYTRNGSEPLVNGMIFPFELLLESNTCLRIRNFPLNESDSLLPSEESIETYFIESHPQLPVISLSTDSAFFFSQDSGIFVTGLHASPDYPYYGANYWQDRKVPVHFEWMESNGRKSVDQWVDAEIHGGSQNRTKPMKSLHLEAKTKYGKNRISHRFFPELAEVDFKSLVLRNGSGDFNKLHCRDEVVHSLMIKAKMDLDLNPYRATKVYFNGQFLGIYNLREKLDKYYLREHHSDIDKDNLDLIEEDQIAWEGDFENWNQLYSFIETEDITQDWVYDSIGHWLDLSNFTDYFIAETFLTNIDWPNNNMKYWRERKPGAKWRYIPIDFDITLGNIGWAPANYNMFKRMFEYIGLSNKQVFMLHELLKNSDYKRRFINRYADAMNAWFNEENLLKHTQDCLENIRNDMPLQFQKWGGSMEAWEAEFDTMAYPYIQQRTLYARENLRDYFQLQSPYELDVVCVPDVGGYVSINSLTQLHHGWKGLYFPEIPIDVKAEANEGYEFHSFQVIADSTKVYNQDSIQIGSNTDFQLQVLFIPSGESSKLYTYPNPIEDGKLQIVWEEMKGEATVIEIYNSIGQKQFSLEYASRVGINQASVFISNWPSGIYTIRCGEIIGKFCKISP